MSWSSLYISNFITSTKSGQFFAVYVTVRGPLHYAWHFLNLWLHHEWFTIVNSGAFTASSLFCDKLNCHQWLLKTSYWWYDDTPTLKCVGCNVSKLQQKYSSYIRWGNSVCLFNNITVCEWVLIIDRNPHADSLLGTTICRLENACLSSASRPMELQVLNELATSNTVIRTPPCLSCEGWQQLQHRLGYSLERNLLQRCWCVATTGYETMMSGFDWLHLPFHAGCLLGWTEHRGVWVSTLPWQPTVQDNAAWHCLHSAARSPGARWGSAGCPMPVTVGPTAKQSLQHV